MASARPEGYPSTPALDITVKHTEEIATINGFIECCRGEGILLAKYRSKHSTMMVTLSDSEIATVIGKTLGIDHAAMQKEQDLVLKWVQEHPQ